MVPAVSGNGGYGEGRGFISSDELRQQLAHLRHQKALVLKLVSLVVYLRPLVVLRLPPAWAP